MPVALLPAKRWGCKLVASRWHLVHLADTLSEADANESERLLGLNLAPSTFAAKALRNYSLAGFIPAIGMLKPWLLRHHLSKLGLPNDRCVSTVKLLQRPKQKQH